ncbi:Histone deacetylase domain [Phytophthora cactorum]|nr:Histone deacetylase domain [Phytophthora cactorum]
MNVGYVYDERYLWHRPWSQHYSALVEPFRHWESPETKRRFHSLLAVSGLLDQLVTIKPQIATKAQLERVHTRRYLEELERLSLREEGGNAGEEAPFSQFAFDIARLSVEESLLLSTRGMGFCLLNNVAITAKHLLETCSTQIKKIAIVDYDVHHGNGTQEAFYDDDRVLFISLHQANNYPADSGAVAEEEKERDSDSTLICHYRQDPVPALESFKPDFVLVSSGFDASYADPLAAMILSSSVFRFMAHELIEAAKRLCRGRIVFAHEGGYSETYVPFCGAAVLEELLGIQDVGKQIKDPFLSEVERWAYQELQEHQKKVVDTVVDLQTNIKQT